MSHTAQPVQSQAPAPRPFGSRSRRVLGQLWFQVVIGAVLGVAVGMLFPDFGVQMAPLNGWFIGLVKMIVVPIIFCVMVTGIASMDNLAKAGRIGVKSLGYFLVLSLLSMVIGLMVANVFKPGHGMNVDASSLDAGATPEGATEVHASFTAFVSNIIPSNFVGAVTGDNIRTI